MTTLHVQRFLQKPARCLLHVHDVSYSLVTCHFVFTLNNISSLLWTTLPLSTHTAAARHIPRHGIKRRGSFWWSESEAVLGKIPSDSPESMSKDFLAGYLPFITGSELFTYSFSGCMRLPSWPDIAVQMKFKAALSLSAPFRQLHRIRDCLCVHRTLGVTCGFQSIACCAMFLSPRLGVILVFSLYGDVDRLLTGSDP